MTSHGECRCRAVRFAAEGAPRWVANCHCADCRKATGAAFATYVCFPEEQVRFTGEAPAEFESSPGGFRAFCARCGTPISFRGGRWPGERHILLGALVDPTPFAPQANAYTKDRLAWVALDERLVAFRTVAGEDSR